MDPKLFSDIENKLDSYVGSVTEPNMRIFCSLYGYDKADVKTVIEKTELVDFNSYKRDYLLSTFKPAAEQETAVVVLENGQEFTRRRRKEIRKEFYTNKDLTVQEFLAEHPEISESSLRNILSKETWTAHYQYKDVRKSLRKDWAAILRTFLAVPELTVQQFCAEQNLNVREFRKHCPDEVWNERFESKYRKIDWDAEIERMKASGMCLEDYANARKLPLLRKKCGEEIALQYDREGLRAKAFDPSLSLEENSKILGFSAGWTTTWIRTVLSIRDPEKFKRFKMDEKDLKIEELEKKVYALLSEKKDLLSKVQKLESTLANKNSYINQMMTTNAQKAAKFSAAKKAIEEALKAL